MKLNCWQYAGCGREPGGAKVQEMGVCPASTASALDGVHGGTEGGRSCWVVAGTFCEGVVQGTHAAKLASCRQCDFYGIVAHQEGEALVPDDGLLEKLRSG